MKSNSWIIANILLLANRQKTAKKKLLYIVKGILFLPFIEIELIKTNRSENDETSLTASGDDVYPLF